jgi:CBS domain-containing protein
LADHWWYHWLCKVSYASPEPTAPPPARKEEADESAKKKRPLSKSDQRLTAGDVMNPSVITVRDDLTVQEVAALLVENEITGAPVTNPRGKLVGVVSATDIAQSAAEGADFSPRGDGSILRRHDLVGRASRGELRDLHVENAGLPVRDIMTPTVFTVPENTPVSRLAKTMISGRIHRLLVTRRGRIVGIVTALDLLKLLVGRK